MGGMAARRSRPRLAEFRVQSLFELTNSKPTKLALKAVPSEQLLKAAWRMARRSGTRKTQLGGGARGLALFIGPFIRTLSGPRSSSAHGLGSPQRAGTREQGAQH
jgi:hypothetical protein